MLWVGRLQCLGEVLVTGTVGGIGLDGGGYLVVSLRLRPGDGVDKVECSLARFGVRHGGVGVDGMQLLLLLLMRLGVAGCRDSRVEVMGMRRRRLLVLADVEGSQVLNKGLVLAQG